MSGSFQMLGSVQGLYDDSLDVDLSLDSVKGSSVIIGPGETTSAVSLNLEATKKLAEHLAYAIKRMEEIR
jgi:hypothetical protein